MDFNERIAIWTLMFVLQPSDVTYDLLASSTGMYFQLVPEVRG